MLDLCSTSFIMSPEAAKAFQVTVVKRNLPMKASDVRGRPIETEALFTIPSALCFENHRSLNGKDHVFEVMKTTNHHDALIPGGT